MKAIIAFLAGLLLGYLLRRPARAWVDPGGDVEWARFDDGYPVAGTVEHQPLTDKDKAVLGLIFGDGTGSVPTWSYAPPNPGSWGSNN